MTTQTTTRTSGSTRSRLNTTGGNPLTAGRAELVRGRPEAANGGRPANENPSPGPNMSQCLSRGKLGGAAPAPGRTFGRRTAAPARRALIHQVPSLPAQPSANRYADRRKPAAPPPAANDDGQATAPAAGRFEDSLGKSEVIAGMSHELRTPLSAIIGFSETVLAETHGPVGDERYRDYVGIILENGAHLLELVDDILALSKIEAGRRALREDEVHLDHTVEAVIRSMASAAGEAGIMIDMMVPRDLPKVRVDERAIRQILLNLLANAIRFSPEGGVVTVAVAIERPSAGAGSGRVTLSVRDEGPGIAPEDIARCLEPFGQAGHQAEGDVGDDDAYRGTGLGLPIVESLAEQHRGGLKIDSTPDAGTTMTVWLPGSRIVTDAASAADVTSEGTPRHPDPHATAMSLPPRSVRTRACSAAEPDAGEERAPLAA